MKKKEQGILTVEASIVLTLFLLFVLFLFSFARMYRAQNMISHATMQSADALALESYIREVAYEEDADEIVKLGNQLSGLTSLSEESFTSLRAADIPKLAKDKFAVAISSSKSNADDVLKKLGVKGGLSGIDFSTSKMDLNSNDVIVYVNYTLELQFPVFGFSEINVTKAAKAKTFGDILFEICTISNDDNMGTASGGGNYKHGTTIEITAEPKYGYCFVGWDDDGDGDVDYSANDAITTTKRMVTVIDAKTYTAIFKNNGYGVNASILIDGVEDTKGIETITIVPPPDPATNKHLFNQKVEVSVSKNNDHYDWLGWSGELRQDKDGDGIEETILTIPEPKNNLKYTIPQVNGTYHLKANFSPKEYDVTIKVKSNVGGSAYFVGTTETYKEVTYSNKVSLEANPSSGYVVDYWMRGTEIIASSYGETKLSDEEITGDVEYTVVFKSQKVNVVFLGPDKEELQTITINSGQNFDDAGVSAPEYDGINGKGFNGWRDFDESHIIIESTKVEGDWVSPTITITASETGHHTITLTAKTYPENAKVNWSHNRSSENYTITESNTDNHKAILTIVDNNIDFDDLEVTKRQDYWDNSVHVQDIGNYTTVTVTATLNIDDSKEASIKLTVEPTVCVKYVMYRKANGKRFYYENRIDNPWSTYNQNTGAFDRTWCVTYSQYKAQADNEVAKNGYYYGNPKDSTPQGGKNMMDKVGRGFSYPKSMGRYGFEALTYVQKFYGDTKSNGDYYDYYISKKENVN